MHSNASRACGYVHVKQIVAQAMMGAASQQRYFLPERDFLPERERLWWQLHRRQPLVLWPQRWAGWAERPRAPAWPAWAPGQVWRPQPPQLAPRLAGYWRPLRSLLSPGWKSAGLQDEFTHMCCFPQWLSEENRSVWHALNLCRIDTGRSMGTGLIAQSVLTMLPAMHDVHVGCTHASCKVLYKVRRTQ